MEQKVPPGLRPSCPTSPQSRTGLTNGPSREEVASGPRPPAASDFLAQTKLLSGVEYQGFPISCIFSWFTREMSLHLQRQ